MDKASVDATKKQVELFFKNVVFRNANSRVRQQRYVPKHKTPKEQYYIQKAVQSAQILEPIGDQMDASLSKFI